MNGIEPILVLLAAFWAGSNVVLVGFNMLNSLRDRIVIGKVDKDILSLSHRKHILYYDWLPLKLGLAGVSAILAIVIYMLHMLPSLAADPETKELYRQIAIVVAFVPACGCLYFLASGFFEFWFIKHELKNSK